MMMDWDCRVSLQTDLMTSFYTHLKGGKGKAAALQAAQPETRARYSHPYCGVPSSLRATEGYKERNEVPQLCEMAIVSKCSKPARRTGNWTELSSPGENRWTGEEDINKGEGSTSK